MLSKPQPEPQPQKLVAIVVPMSNRATLTPDEEISYRHLMHFLGSYDKYMVAPKDVEFDFPEFTIKRFGDQYFGSVAAHRRLMLSREFYEAFQDYKFILIYHLDALAFSDQLLEWCAEDYDYIGAPWLKSFEDPYPYKVGNGGFSLRKVESFLRVIDSRVYAVDPEQYWQKYYADKPPHIQLINRPKKYLKHLWMFNNVRREMKYVTYNEDFFWAGLANHYYPDFNIASPHTALRFAFEYLPRHCFKLNNHTLPFGCHAWPKLDREFWEPYLLK